MLDFALFASRARSRTAPMPQPLRPCADLDGRFRVGFVAVLVVTAVLLGTAGNAAAYTIETQITKGCHESISAEALRSVRTSTGWGAPLPYTDPDDGPLVDDQAL